MRFLKVLSLIPLSILLLQCSSKRLYDHHVFESLPPKQSPQFEKHKANPVKQVKTEPLSTFSIDVDTTSYAYVRSKINMGQKPSKDSVRIEEMINYFQYSYPGAKTKDEPFAVNTTLVDNPWNKKTKLLHIGIKGYKIEKKAPLNLVFLLDTSGSMNMDNKLPLLKTSFKMLLKKLSPQDRVAIVTYAGSAGLVLESTPAAKKQVIMSALDNLSAGGSTAGGAGLTLAYGVAQQNFLQDGVNRIILATDGDFNVGMTDRDELENFISAKRKQGIYFSAIGFGQDNYNDAIMQRLAQNGNGIASFIDNINEARKVMVDEMTANIFPIANDVKIQVEFNPQKVAEYRLVGYESRLLKKEDFNNDKVDAGEIGSGKQVTAIYEIVPTDSDFRFVDSKRYSQTPTKSPSQHTGEYAFVKVRYKKPNTQTSQLMTHPVKGTFQSLENVDSEVRFSLAVAGFAQLIGNDEYVPDSNFQSIKKLAQSSVGSDSFGLRQEFVSLVNNYEAIQ